MVLWHPFSTLITHSLPMSLSICLSTLWARSIEKSETVSQKIVFKNWRGCVWHRGVIACPSLMIVCWYNLLWGSTNPLYLQKRHKVGRWPDLDLIKYYPLWIILLILLVSRRTFLYSKFMLVKNPGNFTISQNELKTYARFVGMCQHLPSLRLDFIRPAHGGIDHAKDLCD